MKIVWICAVLCMVSVNAFAQKKDVIEKVSSDSVKVTKTVEVQEVYNRSVVEYQLATINEQIANFNDVVWIASVLQTLNAEKTKLENILAEMNK